MLEMFFDKHIANVSKGCSSKQESRDRKVANIWFRGGGSLSHDVY